jgi:hypothetical protein
MPDIRRDLRPVRCSTADERGDFLRSFAGTLAITSLMSISASWPARNNCRMFRNAAREPCGSPRSTLVRARAAAGAMPILQVVSPRLPLRLGGICMFITVLAIICLNIRRATPFTRSSGSLGIFAAIAGQPHAAIVTRGNTDLCRASQCVAGVIRE